MLAFMKNIFALFVLTISLYSCDDGDFIVTDFDFDDATLQSCDDFEDDNEFVFFQINNQDEALALNFSTTLNILEESSLDLDDEVYVITLGDGDSVIYRKFDESVTSDYFCTAIPPTTPEVIEELISTDGEVSIRTVGTLMDEDGIPSEIEDPENFDSDDLEAMIDTDGDRLPDIIDFDDDGDNVPTLNEGVVFELDEDGEITGIDTEMSEDTDGDGTPNYLDNDDDGDGVLTINEDPNGDLDPTNDNSDPDNPTVDDYLNNDISIDHNITEFREHRYIFTDILVTIGIQNLIFRDNNDEQETRISSSQSLGVFSAPVVNLTNTPLFN